MKRPIPGGRLYHCRACHLRFRAPRLSPVRRATLYRQAPGDNWAGVSAKRLDWRLAAQWLGRTITGGRVLDVGCHDGGFLASLGPEWERFGVELNPAAAVLARRRGVVVLGRDLHAIEDLPRDFDAAVCLDVIEHVVDPLGLLNAMTRRLRRGGSLLVATGSAEAWTWRLMGARYWYCANPEHLSFISPAWCRHVAPAVGLEILEITPYAHAGPTPLRRRLAEFVKNVGYRLFPPAAKCLRRLGYGGIDTRAYPAMSSTPPMWASARDHFLCVFRKR